MQLIAYGKAMPVALYRRVLCCRSKIGLAMRLSAVLLLGVCLHVSAGTMSQQVTLSEKNVPLQTVFKKIREQTGYTFVYRNDWLQQAMPVTIDVQGANLATVLALCFKDQPFTYEAIRNTIVLRRKETPVAALQEAPAPPPIVKGKVVDEKGKPVVGASVVVRGTKIGVVTKADGTFEIDPGSEDAVLTISYVGFVARTVKIKDGQFLAITLTAADTNMQDMVVTGIVNRRKESFTGAAVSFSGSQLKGIANQSVIQSLRTLDPSFIVTENNLSGSNPNKLPVIEIRGKTAITNPQNSLRSQFSSDPNQPLFIMDGFETSLATVVDLDINRIESITLLKDASSTAIYGARAANGVVVIETKRPPAGQMQLYYNADLKLEMPDLSDYNMMNGEEKLEFERLAGRYTIYSSSLIEEQLYLDSLYASRLYRVRRGVNTYWLNEPVRMGFSQGHSLRVAGGDNNLGYTAGLQYKTTDGVMKGSGRDTWQGNIDLTYRKKKVNIANRMMVSGYNATESPYGSFSSFVNANPYYEKYNADGGVDKYLEISSNRQLSAERIVNPLYNSLLTSFNKNKGFNFQDNLQLTYQLNSSLNATAAVQLARNTSESQVFYASEDSRFDNVGAFERGSFVSTSTNSFSYQANAMLNYGQLFYGIHQLNGSLRAEVQENSNESYMTKAVGFPARSNGNPAFSYSYDLTGRPASATFKYRRNSFLASGSYTFDRRFVADFSYRLDGSTAFGSNKKYSPFWSVGLAWNLHNETFIKEKGWIDLLRIKGNTGATGNQNFDMITSVSVYTYEPLINIFGQGLTLANLGNPNLGWQTTQQTNLGLDFSFFSGKLAGFVNAFEKYTDPLIVAVDLPSSTGLYNYPRNVGHLNNRGIEANIRVSPYRNPSGLTWTIGITGIFQKAIFGGLNKDLESLSKSMRENAYFNRFRDGYSPEDMWAVYSYGIDPASGRELFRDIDGNTTYDHNTKDEVVVGSERPIVEGVGNMSIQYKGFSFNIAVRYRAGGDVLNSALYNKVENISNANVGLNQDKRALYDRWKKVGDISQFKAISITSTTPMSSRFIQEENTLVGESIRLGYDILNRNLLKKVGMRTLSLNAYLYDIFRISTIRRERGIDYPFARTAAFSLSASF